ncbi:MAG TPA: membrane protein FxsA [Bacilli bacterium]|nr:membrane protein FxsA [Bacilli bacterium]
MFKWLLFILITVPLIELSIIIWASSYISVWSIIGMIVLTGFIGATLAKQQGIEALRRAQVSMQNGQLPSDLFIDGIAILIGGLALLMPGFLTDLFGLLLLIPLTRRIFKTWLKAIFQNMINQKHQFIYRRF